MREVLSSASPAVKRLRSWERALADVALPRDLAVEGLAFLEPAFVMRGRAAPREERGFTDALIRGAVCVVFRSFPGRDDALALRVVAIRLPS